MASVLVIDDEPSVRAMLARMLEVDGHEVMATASAREALAHADRHAVDVVVTDMFMPDADGFEVLRAFRDRQPEIGVVAMSGGGGLGQIDVLHTASLLGAIPLPKPIDIAKLRRAIARARALADVTAPRAIPRSAGIGPRPFLPVATASAEEVQRTAAHVLATPTVSTLLDAIPGMVLILNQQRQMVFANAAARARLKLHAYSTGLGSRLGDLLACSHAAVGVCGATDACRTCGAAQSLAGAINRQRRTEAECRILPEHAGGELDLRVVAQPFEVGAERLFMLALTDIADEKRREALEAMFFHDVLNTAGGIRGISELISTATAGEAYELQQTLSTLSVALVEELEQQRGLLQAERGDLEARPVSLDAQAALATVAAHYRAHEAAHGKAIVIEPADGPQPVEIDPTLLGRVLGNMVKNALEATPVGGTIRIRATAVGDDVQFAVWNAGVMPAAARHQVFQRAFSTKGAGRGLGTYGMRLITERYLGGRVTFASSVEEGTEFTATLPARAAVPPGAAISAISARSPDRA